MTVSRRRQRSRLGPLGGLALGFRLWIATAQQRRHYPLTARALRSAFPRLLRSARFGNLESFLVVTPAQIDRFLGWGWDYTERRLQLLQQVSDFPIGADGVQLLMDLRKRMESVRDDPFERVSDAIYRDPVYPVFQHVGQAFRNHVTGRQPFVFDVLSSRAQVPHRVCDVGCGSGILLGDVLGQYPQIQGYGVDVSPIVLDHARRVLGAWHLDGRARLVTGDLRRLPFPNGEFDLVMAMEVLEHVQNPRSGMDELVRILAPDGCLVTSIPVHDPAPVHLYTFSSVEEVVEMYFSAGLVIERQQVTEVAPGVPNVLIAARRRG